MIIGLDHIAIAVGDFEKAIQRFLEDFGIPLDGTEDVVSAKTKTAFFPVSGTKIELIHPLSEDSPVQKFLEKRGKVSYICFKTIILWKKKLTNKGYRFLSDGPQEGHMEVRLPLFIQNQLVAFLLSWHNIIHHR